MALDYDGDGPDTGKAARDRRYRAAHGDNTKKDRQKRYRQRHTEPKKIAILDLETDPFDNVARTSIHPFLAVIYFGCVEGAPDTIVLWNNDHRQLMEELCERIKALPNRYLIYAHNGGRFDYMHLLYLLRGSVQFKGRALMRARIGEHEIRDSLHIIPEALKNANQKDSIDYDKFKRDRRDNYRDEITRYCISDCEYTYEIVSSFVERFGTPITIGQAAMKELKKHYPFETFAERAERMSNPRKYKVTTAIEHLTDNLDAYFRQWFFGGRVECFAPGLSIAKDKPISLIDKNSMYPYCMAYYQHPIGSEFFVHNKITDRTIFITLRCKNNGAFMARSEDGSLDSTVRDGIFETTLWEYRVAKKYRLIRDVEIIKTINFYKFTDFSKFVLPLYDQREAAKKSQAIALAAGDFIAARRLEKDIKFGKYILNNAYGKFAQNPRKFKQYILTDSYQSPDETWWRGWQCDIETKAANWSALPEIEHSEYWLWSKPAPEFRFNNVATAASITGAARAELLEAKHHVKNVLYCDTDSLVCRDTGNLSLDPFTLGGWKVEAEIDQFIAAGKKLYAYRKPGWRDQKKNDKKWTIVKCKGANNVSWEEMEQLIAGLKIKKTLNAPTLTRDMGQFYMDRELRMTL